MENISIQYPADVRSFIYYCIVELDLGAGFHPDTPMADYTQIDEDDMVQLTFHPDFASDLQKQLDKCFAACKAYREDIHATALGMAQRLGFCPMPTDWEDEAFRLFQLVDPAREYIEKNAPKRLGPSLDELYPSDIIALASAVQKAIGGNAQ